MVYPRVYRKILRNGLHVVLIPVDHTDVISTGFFVKVGSRYEDKENNGIAHFLEHMMFRGTNKRTSDNIVSELDNLGATYNAETSYESTCYYISGHKNDFNIFLELLIDLYFNPAFREEDIKNERFVVVEELNAEKDNPIEIITNMVNSKLFVNSSLQYPIIGTKKNILSFRKDDLTNFRKKFYVPNRSALVICGDIDRKYTFKQIKKLIKSEHVYDKNINVNIYGLPINDQVLQTKPEVYTKKKTTSPQTQLIISFSSYNHYSTDDETLDLLADILTLGSSSRLFSLLRNKLGAIYFSTANNNSFIHEGIFTIHAGVNNNKVLIVIKKILEELYDIKKNGITKDELDKVKKMRVTSFALSLQTPFEYMHYYGGQELLYKFDNDKTNHIGIKSKIERYEKVDVKDIIRVANNIFTSERMNIFVYGKVPSKKMLQQVIFKI